MKTDRQLDLEYKISKLWCKRRNTSGAEERLQHLQKDIEDLRQGKFVRTFNIFKLKSCTTLRLDLRNKKQRNKAIKFCTKAFTRLEKHNTKIEKKITKLQTKLEKGIS